MLPNRIEMRVGLIEQEQRALSTRNTDKTKHHEELAFPVREIGEAHVAACVIYPRHPYMHVTEQVGDIDRFERGKHFSIIWICASKASQRVRISQERGELCFGLALVTIVIDRPVCKCERMKCHIAQLAGAGSRRAFRTPELARDPLGPWATLREPWFAEVCERRVEIRDAQFVSEKFRDRVVWKGEEGEQREHAVDRSTIEEPTLDKGLPACLGVVVRLDGVVVPALVAIKELFEPPAPPE